MSTTSAMSMPSRVTFSVRAPVRGCASATMTPAMATHRSDGRDARQPSAAPRPRREQRRPGEHERRRARAGVATRSSAGMPASSSNSTQGRANSTRRSHRRARAHSRRQPVHHATSASARLRTRSPPAHAAAGRHRRSAARALRLFDCGDDRTRLARQRPAPRRARSSRRANFTASVRTSTSMSAGMRDARIVAARPASSSALVCAREVIGHARRRGSRADVHRERSTARPCSPASDSARRSRRSNACMACS